MWWLPLGVRQWVVGTHSTGHIHPSGDTHVPGIYSSPPGHTHPPEVTWYLSHRKDMGPQIPLCEQTHACKNFTFPQTSFAGGKHAGDIYYMKLDSGRLPLNRHINVNRTKRQLKRKSFYKHEPSIFL